MPDHVTSDEIRNYVLRRLIEPARLRGETRVTVQAGEVHRALGLENRVPLVCSALKAKTHWKRHGLRIVAIEGPLGAEHHSQDHLRILARALSALAAASPSAE